MATATQLPRNVEALARKPRSERFRDLLREQFEALPAETLEQLDQYAVRQEFNVLDAQYVPGGLEPGQLIDARNMLIVHCDYLELSRPKNAAQMAKELTAAMKKIRGALKDALARDAAKRERIAAATEAFRAKEERERLEAMQLDPMWRIEQLEAAVDSIRKHLKIL